ncbi:hypothetical protein PENTCL1PPCAC_18462 [Pristionchus entomophagus]|uniref:Activin types I and II receptor domain-containing protein n=1 Tax=Pristionchus entomophagus TaxID=358040 RepID=A0AAV5TQ24_9BILA|nr:hypothetical protein PENTCL1PPCAC_18462 [Pristionchus entomophagus]
MHLRLLLSVLLIATVANCLDDSPRCYKGRELNALLSMPCDALKDVDKVLCETGTCHDLGRSLPPDALFCCCSQKHPSSAMKLILVFSVLVSTAAALHCFVGTLLLDSYNKLPTKDCGDIDQCINGTMENEDGGLFMAGCDQLVIATYGSPDRQVVTCPKNEATNTCNSIDVVGADNVTSKVTRCCCNDDWCNKSAFGIHSIAVPLMVLSAIKWII